MIKRGEIYLANLNPKKGNEVGKLRPVLVLQTDMLNEISHPTVIILPLSTKLVDEAYPLRFRINKRDRLEKDSDILCDQIRAIDINRLKSVPLTLLTEEEIVDIEHRLEIILGFIQ
ncbi:type II toxin-antitoxin system PemK/MazF family toxin [Nitrosophilus alvini]|uniref:type II toxin-antitoxin system PemK/MazF family toxin n=1 Tax=Nitrosophilus alvini TaxID=2714855 RepID=UPI00190DD7B5|nr:type II toxin-antitoxin system PemK/MazF family toxin [Nitrosophilus alvini]